MFSWIHEKHFAIYALHCIILKQDCILIKHGHLVGTISCWCVCMSQFCFDILLVFVDPRNTYDNLSHIWPIAVNLVSWIHENQSYILRCHWHHFSITCLLLISWALLCLIPIYVDETIEMVDALWTLLNVQHEIADEQRLRLCALIW